MATVEFTDSAQTFDITSLLVTYNDDASLSRGPSSYQWRPDSGSAVVFDGAGFSYANGVPNGGSALRFTLRFDGNSAPWRLTVSNPSLDLSTLAPLSNGSFKGSGAQINENENNLVWRKVLAGDDTFNLGSTATARSISIQVGGDGRHVEAGQDITGGSDAFIGDGGNATGRFLVGDFHRVLAGAVLRGGNDTFTVASGHVEGDADQVAGTLFGGNDAITVTAAIKADEVIGDAHSTSTGGRASGGGDTIDVSATIGSKVWGDFVTILNGGTGGDDTVTGSGEADFIVGDAQFVDGAAPFDGGKDEIRGGGGDDEIYGDWQVAPEGTRSRGGADTLRGDGGDDKLFGNGGNDTLEGGAGLDELRGGDDDDTLVVAGQGQLLAGETYNGGSGADTLVFSDDAGYEYDLRTVTLASIETLRLGENGGEASEATLRLDAGQFGGGISLQGTVEGIQGRADVLDVTVGTQSALDLSKLAMAGFADSTDQVVITGGTGRQAITGTAASDAIEGGLGDDRLDGGEGSDTLVLNGAGSGYTFTRQSAKTWTVTGNDGTDTVTGFETVKFADATVGFRTLANGAPTLAKGIANQTTPEDGPVLFQVPADAFADPDEDDLSLSATLSDGSALPSWLSFDPAQRSFSGQPPFDFNGAIRLKVTASDGVASASGAFTLTVTPVNDAPTARTSAFPNLPEGGTATLTSDHLQFTDAEQGPAAITYTLTRDTEHGTLVKTVGGAATVLGLNGTFTQDDIDNNRITYRHDGSEGPLDFFGFTVSDGAGGTVGEQGGGFSINSVNDAPSITSGKGGAKASYSVAENKAAVATLKASDPDSKKLTWSLSGGADAKLFAIDAKTGALSFKAAPDFEAPKDAGRNNTYDVTVKVSEGKLADTQAVAVKVTDENKTRSGDGRANALSGTKGKDTLKGLAGNDTLKGLGGDDRLEGGAGADRLHGGDGDRGMGADTFVFTALTDSTVSAKGQDTIFDFASGDRIDLSAIDANGKAKGSTAFTFIGTDKFGGDAGELRFEKGRSDTFIYADTNGDRRADMTIHLDDALKLVKGDFVL